MSKKANYSYIGIAFIILLFGIIFIPKIIDRITKKDIVRNESRSDFKKEKTANMPALAFIEVNGVKRRVPPFQFINQTGATITNKDYLGKVYIVDFFFTSCPTICPLMTQNLVAIQNAFKGVEAFGVASFSIDPKRDTPKALNTYAKKYGITNPNWNLLTGNQDAIYKLANEGFYIYAAENKNVLGGFEHSGNFALVDKKGFIRSRKDTFGNPIIYYNGTVSESQKVDDEGHQENTSILKQDIQQLLDES